MRCPSCKKPFSYSYPRKYMFVTYCSICGVAQFFSIRSAAEKAVERHGRKSGDEMCEMRLHVYEQRAI